uniref:Uncharacterized protein n=1 Tax=Lepeophtheirus salmonis TaxID=72036 RepID=A0A0K2UIR7_LEPSM
MTSYPNVDELKAGIMEYKNKMSKEPLQKTCTWCRSLSENVTVSGGVHID